MKKLILLIVFIMILGLVSGFADTSEFYVKTIPIVKIYDHSLGYRVVYMKNNFELTALYLPKEWFRVAAETGEAPKAEIIAGKDSSFPYFSVFWKSAEFDHIRLYVHSDLGHSSWGDLDPLVDMTEKFQVETLELQ